MPPDPGHHKGGRFESLPSRASFANDIAVFEVTFGEFEHGGVADHADLQPSDIGATERCCGGTRLGKQASRSILHSGVSNVDKCTVVR